MSLAVAFGVVVAITGLLLITFRPKRSPLVGRVLIALGALVIVAVLYHIAGQPTFRPDR
jgi:hypothetical protein